MTRKTNASVAEDADYDETLDAGGDPRGYTCQHCGARVVSGYDGRGSGWSHIYGDGRDGTRDCGRAPYVAPADARHAHGCFCPGDCGCNRGRNVCGCAAVKHAATSGAR